MHAFTILTALVAASVATVHALPTGTRGNADNGRDVVARVPGEDASRVVDGKNARGLFRFRRTRQDQTVKTESSRSILRSMIPSRRRRDAKDEQGVYQRGNAKSVESVVTAHSYSSNGQGDVMPTLRRESMESVTSGNSGYSHGGRAGVKQLARGRERTESVASGTSNYSHESSAGVTQLIQGRESTESVATSSYSHAG